MGDLHSFRVGDDEFADPPGRGREGAIPGLSRDGALRAQIESVRVHSAFRGRGQGRRFFAWAIAESRRRGCALVQLTSDRTRADAHSFYARLGFVDSHVGYKLDLAAG